MKQPDLVQIILATPQMRMLKDTTLSDKGVPIVVPYPASDKRAAVEAYLPSVLQAAAAEFDFDFVCKITTHTGGSTINVADYTFTGDDNNCADVIDILYGSNELMLVHLSAADMDRYLSNLEADERPVEVEVWTEKGRTNGFPTVHLVGTPDATGETMKYRFRRNNVTIEEWPEGFVDVLIDGTLKRFIPDYLLIYKDSVRRMIDHYSKSKVSASPVPTDPIRQQRFREIARLHGYSQFGSVYHADDN